VRKDGARHRCFRNRIDVTRRHRPVAERDVALGADKLRVPVSLVKLGIESAAVFKLRSDVTTFSPAARLHRHLLRLINSGVELRHLVTLRALQLEIPMNLVFESSRGNTIARSRQRPPVLRFHRRNDLFIKVHGVFPGRAVFVTGIAVRGQRRKFTLGVVTCEARGVSERPCFERALVRLMAIVTGGGVLVFAMREKHTELGNEAYRFCGREKWFAKTRKRISSRVLRRSFHMAVGTDAWRRSLASEELLPMAIKACCMFRKLVGIWKVTRTTCQLFFRDVSGMRKTRVIGARASLCFNRDDG